MALVLADRVKETTTTTGTGTVTLLGASTGFQSFAVIGNANTTYYAIVAQTGTEWEVGIGTYTLSGTLLARTTVLSNSAGTQPSALSFSAGTKDVFVTYPSSKSVNLDASGNATALGTPASGVVTNLTGTASININGTVGATTASTGAFTTLSATGVASFSAGTALLPAITRTGDTNTGIWFPAADTIAFTEGGVESMRIDSSGNVGIGTTTPVAQLGVYGTGQTTAAMSTSSGLGGTLYVRDSGSAANNGGAIMFGANQGAFATIKGLLQDGATNTRGDLAFSTRNAVADATLTERMRITSAGNVGIGTTSPTEKLNVSGNVLATAGVTGSVVTASNGLVVNSNTVSASYSIPSGSSAMSAGPMSVSGGVVVTVPSGSRWVVL